jgi:hypothetical protein
MDFFVLSTFIIGILMQRSTFVRYAQIGAENGILFFTGVNNNTFKCMW